MKPTTVTQGEIWWTDFEEPVGSEAGYLRPAVVIQGDDLNRSWISTVIVVPLTSTLRWAGAPGNVVLKARFTGLPKDSVANVSLVGAIDRSQLIERTGRLTRRKLDLLFEGLDTVLGRTSSR